MEKKYGAFSSSTDYNSLSKTVEGVITSLSSIIILFASLKGIPVSQDAVVQIAQQAGVTIGAFGTFVGAVIALFGLIRKVVVRFTTK